MEQSCTYLLVLFPAQLIVFTLFNSQSDSEIGRLQLNSEYLEKEKICLVMVWRFGTSKIHCDKVRCQMSVMPTYWFSS